MRGQPRWAVAIAAALLVVGVQHSDAKKSRHHNSGPDSTPASSPPASQSQAPAPAKENAAPAQQPPVTGKGGAPTQNSENPTTLTPTATVVDKQEVQTILGKNVRSSAGEDMGRLVDVLVDREGQPRAAIIDFGGFLGVGSRKIAVDWKALQFSPDDPKGNTIALALTRDQVKAAPEYKDGSPAVILGALGNLTPFSRSQEK
jgi:PRC-barrel domain